MIAYKAFAPGLVCRGYQFKMGRNTTDKANCAQNGFHCAENPLDCLSYYSDIAKSEFFIVKAEGDIDEDSHDTKIACTELHIVKQLSFEEFLLHGLAFVYDHPKREWSSHVKKDCAQANNGYVVVRGCEPRAKGKLGDILAFAREDATGKVIQVALSRIDGKTVMPDIWYGADLTQKEVAWFEQTNA